MIATDLSNRGGLPAGLGRRNPSYPSDPHNALRSVPTNILMGRGSRDDPLTGSVPLQLPQPLQPQRVRNYPTSGAQRGADLLPPIMPDFQPRATSESENRSLIDLDVFDCFHASDSRNQTHHESLAHESVVCNDTDRRRRLLPYTPAPGSVHHSNHPVRSHVDECHHHPRALVRNVVPGPTRVDDNIVIREGIDVTFPIQTSPCAYYHRSSPVHPHLKSAVPRAASIDQSFKHVAEPTRSQPDPRDDVAAYRHGRRELPIVPSHEPTVHRAPMSPHRMSTHRTADPDYSSSHGDSGSTRSCHSSRNSHYHTRFTTGHSVGPDRRRYNRSPSHGGYESGASSCHDRDPHRRHPHRGRRSDPESSPSPNPRSPPRCRVPRKDRHWMKPDKFDGGSSFESFIAQFENCARYNDWDEKDQAAYLRWSMSGPAAQLLWGAEKDSYKTLVEKLRSRYGSRDMEEKFQSELRCRRRGRNEPIKELAQDVRRLMALAYPGENSSLSEHIARDAFLTALDDPEFELKIREREPQNLDTAVKIALRYEVFKSTAEGHGRTKLTRFVENEETGVCGNADRLAKLIDSLETKVRSIDDTKSRVSQEQQSQQKGPKIPNQQQRRNRATTPNDPDRSWRDDLLRSLEELKESQASTLAEVAKVKAQHDSMDKELGRLRHLDQLRSIPSVTIPPPLVPPQDLRPQCQSRANSRPQGCFNCGNFGHISRNCPERRQRAPPNVQAQAQSSSNNETRNRATANPSSSKHESPSAYLLVTLGKQVCRCLLDTGSEMSVLPTRYADPKLIENTTQVLRAANGSEIPLRGQVSMPIHIGNVQSSVLALVTDHVSEVMLGIDWLTENGVIWDFHNQRIKIGDEYRQLSAKPLGDAWCRRLIVSSATNIDPRSESILLTSLVMRHPGDIAKPDWWSTVPSSVASNVHVARTVLPRDQYVNVPVRVLNTSTKPYHLAAGAFISDLEPIEIIKAEHGQEPKETMIKQAVDPLGKLLNRLPSNIPDGSKAVLSNMLNEYSDVFSMSEHDLGLTGLTSHVIDTGSARPIRQPLRRFPPAHVQAISEQVATMLQQDVIEPAASPWASNLVLVKKKDGSYRVCVDYRPLNNVTSKDAYPLPRIDQCLDAMSGAKWFSTFDLRSSYHQLPVNPADRDKTAFICPRGMFRFKTMPFGLCNAGASFQRLMDIVMSGLQLEICLVYLDDIIVYSSTLGEHFQRLTTIFERLRRAGLKLKPEKCNLLQESVSFLGHVISRHGIGTDPSKIEAVSAWPTPTCQKDVRSFLGLASYYRRFIRDFASKAAPLNGMLHKSQKFSWSQSQQDSLDLLKSALVSSPVLAMPNDEGHFTLDTDASDFAIGAVLSQTQDGQERVIAYASKSLDRRQRNYCVTRKELYAVVYFLGYFKQYLLGRQFTVRTDHAALSWLRRTPDPIGQQGRWLERMEEYDFNVVHRAGKQHSNADAMSRHPCTKNCCRPRYPEARLSTDGPADETPMIDSDQPFLTRKTTRHTTTAGDGNESNPIVLPWSHEGLIDAQKSDPDISFIYSLIAESPQQPTWDTVADKSYQIKCLWYQWPRFEIRQGLLKRRFETIGPPFVRWQVVWPQSLRDELLKIVHSGPTAGHMSRSKTAIAIQSRAYWPSWSSDLDKYLKTCAPCAQYHRGRPPRQAKLQSPLVGEPWERVSIDITGPHPCSSRGNKYILTLVDHFSRWAEAVPLYNHTSAVVAKALVNNVFSRFGAPMQILSDQGPEFESELFSQLMRWFAVDKLRTTPYKPSTNGMVERFHRTLNTILGKIVNQSQRDWDDCLPFAMTAYRSTVHSSTNFTPSLLFLGREVRMPIDLVMGLPPDDEFEAVDYDEFVVEMRRRADFSYAKAREILGNAASQRRQRYDIRVRVASFQVGDWVWYLYPRRYPKKSPKWQKHYTGPFLVIRTIGPANYVIQKSQRSKAFVVHCDKLKKCFSATPASWLNGSAADPVPDADAIATDADSTDSQIDEPETDNPHGDDPPPDPSTRPRRSTIRPPQRYNDYVI